MRIIYNAHVSCVLIAAASALVPIAAHAQATAKADANTNPDAGQSVADPQDDIIVTANRRAERLQDVPIAVNVLSNDALRSANVADTQFLANLVPGLSITKTNSSQYFLRGIGSSSTTINSEQSVAAYIDGVYVYTTYGSLSLANLERVEVLRGPQGTLFGRNTTGGVIQAVTRDPLAAPSLEAEIGYGNYRTLTGKFYGSVHLASNLGVSLSVDFRDQGRGYGFNAISGDRVFFRNDITARAKIAYEPTANTTITAFFQYRRSTDSGINYIPIAGTRGLDRLDGSAYGRFEIRADAKNSFSVDSYLAYLRMEQKIGDFATLTSITSYHDVKPFARFDQDATPLNIVTAVQDLSYRNFSQEVQLASRSSTPLSWVAGVYYYNAEATILPLDLTGSFTGASGRLRYYRRQRAESIAGFGQLTYQFLPHTKLTAGLRYTSEKEKLPDGLYTLVGNDPNPTRLPFAADTQDSSGWTWRLALDHEFTRNVMAYVSWNRGLKSGGFTLSGTVKLPGYSPERLDSYEAGLKTTFLNGRVRINPAVFLYKFQNIQYGVLTAGGSAITNAASATISGFDLDAGVKISDRLELNGAFEYLHSRFDSFTNATFFVPVAAPAGGAVTLNNQNASGNDLPYAPKTSASLGLAYKVPLVGGDLRFDGAVRYVDDQFIGPSNRFVNPSYTLVSASLGWTSSNKRFGVRVWADNLFDENYATQVFESAVGIFRIPGAPRTFGVTLSTKLF